MTPTKIRSAAYRARKKVRDSDALVRLERYEDALAVIFFLSTSGDSQVRSRGYDERRDLLKQISAVAKRVLP